jgi:hypothetical protein
MAQVMERDGLDQIVGHIVQGEYLHLHVVKEEEPQQAFQTSKCLLVNRIVDDH